MKEALRSNNEHFTSSSLIIEESDESDVSDLNDKCEDCCGDDDNSSDDFNYWRRYWTKLGPEWVSEVGYNFADFRK